MEPDSSRDRARCSWFAAAELKFEVAHITGERERFAHAVGAMGFTVLRAVLDLVENPPAELPYSLHYAEGPPGTSSSADTGPEGYQVPTGCG